MDRNLITMLTFESWYFLIMLTLCTSLIPGSRLGSKAAIYSWQRAGFEIKSINSQKEASQITKIFPDIVCDTVLRDGSLIAGRPVIYINDILENIRKTGNEIGGITNSDIIIGSSSKIKRFVANLPIDTLLICPRNDVEHIDQLDGEIDDFGYDTFFFHNRLIGDWHDNRFALGMPFWDHWFPIMSLLSGRRVLKLVSKNFRHVRHSTHRDTSFFMFNSHFAQIIISKMEENTIGFGDGFDHSLFAGLWTIAQSELTPALILHRRPKHSKILPDFLTISLNTSYLLSMIVLKKNKIIVKITRI